MQNQTVSDTDIAIIGMACRVPGAKDVSAFWRNLRDGVESILFCSDEQLRATLTKTLGHVPEDLFASWINNPQYVRAAAGIEDIDLFDAAFFGYSSTEAENLEPQQRIFLECAWEALEDASYTTEDYRGLIGVYGGSEVNSSYNANASYVATPSERDLQALMGCESGYLTTRVSYKLNLRGPSINVQSACSTSLVAIHMACQGLKAGECDIALAGGVTAYTAQQVGYFYQEGSVFSPDGHCRPFDANARGTVFGNGGVGVVVLKRLGEALADGDHIYAVIKGSATNNDGSLKTGYTAPAIDGQAQVIAEAIAVANISADSVSYVEAHGTATPLGDPIEVMALTQAFRHTTRRKNFCALGSVKSNIGHLGVAAGVISLIKTVLSLQHKMIPPSLNYEQPNPRIDFDNSPFFVNTQLTEWQPQGGLRRAGVSSFGIGGTNAHVILEGAPELAASSPARSHQLLVLSAKTESALQKMKSNLAEHLNAHPDLDLADLAFTLQVGRKHFPYRYQLTCRTQAEAREKLSASQGVNTCSINQDGPVAFLFSGQGSQYVNMGRDLYEQEPAFRKVIDHCCDLLRPYLGLDLRTVLYPKSDQEEAARQQLNQTCITQPALFVIEYALAKLWMRWGVQPDAMIGHSIGEYVAACLAGVFPLEDALEIVAVRGQLMQEMSEGSMLSVSLPARDVRVFLHEDLSLAASNSVTDSVVSGPTEVIVALEQVLSEKGIACRRLHTSHAFHSRMMEPILQRFMDVVSKATLHPPQIPFVSNVTGTWITERQATDSGYWAQHVCQPVRFADGLGTLMKNSMSILLEVGPGRTLTTFARRHPDKRDEHLLTSLRHPQETEADLAFLLNTLGLIWCTGKTINWSRFYEQEHRHRLSLPAYPFERRRYWLYPRHQQLAPLTPQLVARNPDLTHWFSIPSWRRSVLPSFLTREQAQGLEKSTWLIFADTHDLLQYPMTDRRNEENVTSLPKPPDVGDSNETMPNMSSGFALGASLLENLEREGYIGVTVLVGKQFGRVSERVYTIRPQCAEDYDILCNELHELALIPTKILHMWTITDDPGEQNELAHCSMFQEIGFYSQFLLLQALGRSKFSQPVQLITLTNNLQEVIGHEIFAPSRASVLGPSKVIMHEYPHITCRTIDVILPAKPAEQDLLLEQLLAELMAPVTDAVVAYRGSHRWVQVVEPLPLERWLEGSAQGTIPRRAIRERGVYLIIGGLGGIGLELARYLASTAHVRLVLTARTALPPRSEWEQWNRVHDPHSQVAQRIRQIQELEKLGAEVLLIAVDVTNPSAMQAVITRIFERFDGLHGVIHAAGTVDPGVIQLKAIERAARVLMPKVEGTLVLSAVLEGIPLDFFILCSSLYSVLGGSGQVDYCAANAFLDCFAFCHTARTGIPTIAINWDAWQEVGMAVNTGVMRKSQQMNATSPTSSAWSANAVHPLLERSTLTESGEYLFTTELRVTKHWFLYEHRIRGMAAVAGTTLLEMVRAALAILTQSEMVEIYDVFFFTPLTVENNETKEMYLTLKQEDHDFHFLITSKDALANDEEVLWQHHAEGKVRVLAQKTQKKFEIDSFKRRVEMVSSSVDKLKNKAEFMQFGPRWQVLQSEGFSGDEGLALLELAENFSADLEALKLHPALLDVATSFAAYHHAVANDVAYLPFSYKKLRINKGLPGRLYSYVKRKAKSSSHSDIQEFLVYDIVIADEQGTILVEIEDFCLRRVDTTALQLQVTPRNSARTSHMNEGGMQHQQSRNAIFEGGILPQEGIEAFERVLYMAPLPQIIVSPRDIQALLKQPDHSSELFTADARSIEQMSASSVHMRPNVQTAYIAPRTVLEQQIAEIWQKVLGIDRVGVQDNFFDLGGDSVMIMQINKRLYAVCQIELPVHLFFEARTVEELAALIVQRQMAMVDQAQMEQLLQQVNAMSEEEAALLLQKDQM